MLPRELLRNSLRFSHSVEYLRPPCDLREIGERYAANCNWEQKLDNTKNVTNDISFSSFIHLQKLLVNIKPLHAAHFE